MLNRLLLGALLIGAAPRVTRAQESPPAAAETRTDTGSEKKGKKATAEQKAQRDSADARAGQAFFASDSVLTLTLRTDLRAVLKDRDTATAKWHPARITYADSAGAPVTVDASVRTRGIFRLRPGVCAFPPLRLNFARKSTAGTRLAGLDRPKLVTHCQNERPEYEQIILHEYLLYRMYNLFTPVSFNVRLARLTYEDTQGRLKPLTAWAFIIEEDRAMAARNGGRIIKQRGARPGDLDEAALNLVSVFQYMIGNTDWSVSGLHNATLVQNKEGNVLPVPYDFDFSGIIGARYAGPSPQLPIKSIRERLYRGTCVPEARLRPTLELFRARRDAIYAVYDQAPALEPAIVKRARSYLDEFFKIIDDEDGPKYQLLSSCLRERVPE